MARKLQCVASDEFYGDLLMVLARWHDWIKRVPVLCLTIGVAGCNPYAPLIGKTFSYVDEYKETQRDSVSVVVGSQSFNLKLDRQKNNGIVDGYSAIASITFPESFNIHSLTFDVDGEKLVLNGGSTVSDVSAKSYGVYYTMLGVYPITPDQVRKLATASRVIVTPNGPIDLTSVEIGEKGLGAIDVFRETFVDSDGIGDNVIRSKVRKSE